APAVKKPPPPPANDSDDFGLTVSGLPLIKPPYATISAINLDRGDIVWQVAHGESPNFIRTNPALKGLNIPRTGQTSYNIGALVTKSLVIAGDAQVTVTPDHPRGAMLRAYDQNTGKEVGSVLMPAGQSGSPMTYLVNGKQYIIVAVSGGNYSGEDICFTPPNGENMRRGVLILLAAMTANTPALAASIWDGVYTEAQAVRGNTEFVAHCANCHGADLGGTGEAPALAGPQFLSDFDGLSLGDLFDRVRTT